jgi:hypothetical protein
LRHENDRAEQQSSYRERGRGPTRRASTTPEENQEQATKLRAIISIGDMVYESDFSWKQFKRRVLSSGLITPLEGELEALNSDLFD